MALDETKVVEAFLAASRAAWAVLALDAVTSAWDRPSSLARMTVGGVAGHLYLVVRRVDRHLDDPVDATRPSLPAMIFPRVEHQDDLDLELHARVRRDGERAATRGPAQLRSDYDERVERLARRLRDEPLPGAVALGDRDLAFVPYLGSRVVEVLVHADDLAVSVGLELPPLPEDAVEVAVAHVVDAARRAHGDLGLLRSFTRRERVPSWMPAIY